MKYNKLNTPWSLHFDKDGTEDIAVICDADGEELVTSRPFWLTEGDDPVPATLAALRLMLDAPNSLAACQLVTDRWEHGDLAEAARACADAIAGAGRKVGKLTEQGNQRRGPDIHELLAADGKIAVIWSVEDVQEIRPDLTADQAWQVLQRVENEQDASLGITWDTLEWAATDLFDDAPEPDAA